MTVKPPRPQPLDQPAERLANPHLDRAEQQDSTTSVVPPVKIDTAGRLPVLGLAALLLVALAVLSAWLWQSGAWQATPPARVKQPPASLAGQPPSDAPETTPLEPTVAPVPLSQQPPLMLVPAVGGLNACLDLAPPAPGLLPQPASCDGAQGSAAEVIEQYLRDLGPSVSADGHFVVGYTLVLPLLDFFRSDGHGGWALDQTAVQRVANTVAKVRRPVVLYFFSTHFGVEAPIEPVLAGDPRNLAETPAGPLSADHFLGAALYPWSIARTDNTVTARREQALRAIVDAVCLKPADARQRIAGVNLLGEVHQLYPHFENGMGLDAPYVVTDYSAISRAGFRAFLRQRFNTVAALNAALGTTFESFDQIEPPAGNAAGTPFWQRLDSYSMGQFSVSGWARDLTRPTPDADPAATPWLRVYLDGAPMGRIAARYSRQDVIEARPDLGTARVGWRLDLDYHALAPGVHRVDVVLEHPYQGQTLLIHLGMRNVVVFDWRHPDTAPPAVAPMRQPLPLLVPPDRATQFSFDNPANDLALRYNPLATAWNDFRGQQVIDYLEHFSKMLDGTCLAAVPRRTQQIFPAFGAGWDETRFASAPSRRPFDHVQLGVNLYGDTVNDPAFFAELARNHQKSYSITEFHPLRALTAPQLRAILETHRAHGARTLSFFLHPTLRDAQGRPVVFNPFSIDPGNPGHGSDVLYRSMQQILTDVPGGDVQPKPAVTP
jgi:hypothetical protein